MSVEALSHAMNYVIEAWMIGSGIYLGIGFTASLTRRIRADLAAAQSDAQVSNAQVSNAQIEEGEADRLAEVSAVSKQYAKSAKADAVSVSVNEG
ncbi:MAG: hypothetical protein AAFZ80_05440 [Cyanobacteria bacterium P01_A01_bin.105]